MDRRPEGSRRIVAAVALVLMAVLVAGVWWFTSRPRVTNSPVVPVAAPTAAQPQPEPEASTARQRVELASALSSEASATAAIPAEGSAAALKADLSSRLWATVHVEDQNHEPIADARVVIDTLRREGDTGSAWSPREANPEAVTDFFGNARIWYWEWTSIDGRTAQVDLSVKHPDHSSVRMRGVPLGPGPIVVVLETGNVLIIGAKTVDGLPVKEFLIHTDQDSDVEPSPWIARADGRQESSQLGAGKHTLWIEHSSFELGRLFSEPITFEIASGTLHELSLVLKPGGPVIGMLDPIVPRPVHRGKVRLIIHVGDPNIGRFTEMEADIKEDGTFRIENAPGGLCEVFALCSGWVTTRTAEYNQDRLTDLMETDLGSRRPWHAIMIDHCYQLQRIRIPSAQPEILRMERTGRVTIHVSDETGSPLADADANVSPNIIWLPNTSTITPWREWEVKTNAQGVAVIEDVPPDACLWSGAKSEHHQLPAARRADSIEYVSVVKSGETTDITIQLEPKTP